MLPERRVSNLLALAVLSILDRRPMHPYEIAFEIRAEALGETIKLNYGSLYTVVEALQREGLIVPVETRREGRRPERTVYGLTDAGRQELGRWLRDVLRQPVREYPQFAAGLALAHHLPATELIAVLDERVQALEDEIEETSFILSNLREGSAGRPPLPRFYLIEIEYGQAMREAERDWIQALITQIRDGTLPLPAAEAPLPWYGNGPVSDAPPSHLSEGGDGP